jgi:thiol-disulfide isomerase/thioredoxin
MTEENTAAAPKGLSRGKRITLYTLVALLAAIAGFLSAWLASAPEPPAPGSRTAAALASAPDVTAKSAGAGGLDMLVWAQQPKPLADIAFTDAGGRERRLSEWRGKTVLVNLWATWCAPCIREMPSLNRLQARLGGADFTVLAISLDRGGPDKPGKFLTSNNLSNLGLYLDQKNDLMASLGVIGLPLTVLVDREGREVARLAGPAEWDTPEAEAAVRRAMSGERGG